MCYNPHKAGLSEAFIRYKICYKTLQTVTESSQNSNQARGKSFGRSVVDRGLIGSSSGSSVIQSPLDVD